jgi:multiple sugar transport system substrate-binding protein
MRFYELSGDLPAHRAAWATPKLANDKQIAAFRIQLDRTVALPRIPEWENVATSVFEYGQLGARGRYTAREAALQLDRKVDGMLEKRRWVLSR